LLIYSLYICYSKSDLSQVRNGKPLRFVFWGSLRPSADWVWDWVWDWVALGWPKRGPSVAQGRPKRRFKKVLCLQQKLKKGRVGRKSPEIAENRRDRRDRV
jgi:hypothetical protein